MQEKQTKMWKRSSVRGGWNILRLSLQWAKKGGIFKNRHIINLRVITRIIKKVTDSDEHNCGALVYGDREFSFEDTPVVHVKMHRPCSSLRFKMPCIVKPQVDFDCDEDDYDENNHVWCEDSDDFVEEEEYYDEAIDVKAEMFIAKFYEQMKLQRDISSFKRVY
ncbi:hypothetical protein ACP275_04G009500 [Erythranthe tilingii]